MKRMALAIGMCAIVASAAMAQDKPSDASSQPASKAAERKVDPEAQKLIDAAKDAVKKLRDVSYSAKQEMDMGGDKRKATGQVAVTLRDRSEGFPIAMYRIALHGDDGKPATEWAFNGKQIQKLDHAAKKLFTLESSDIAMPPEEIWPLLPQWIFEDSFGGSMAKTVSATVMPAGEIAGVKCKVVEQVQEMELPSMDEEGAPGSAGDRKKPKMVLTSVKHLGGDDLLPRKFEMRSSVEGGAEGMDFGMSIRGEFSGLKANAGLKPEDYVIKAPDGFAKEVGTPANMGLESGDSGQPELKAKPGEPALDFTLKDADGKEHTMAGLKGRVVLLDFWATWCGPCKAAMPSVQKLHEKYKDKPVSVIGVDVWERAEGAGPKYMKSKNYTYTCLLDGDDLAKRYGISGIPTMILIDKDGKVLKTLVGFDEGEMDALTKLIDEQLAKK